MAKWVTFPYRIYYKKKKPYFHMKKKLQTCHSIWITSKSIWTNNDQKFRTMFWFTLTYRVTSNSICVDAVFLLDHQLSCYIRHPSAIEVKRNKSKLHIMGCWNYLCFCTRSLAMSTFLCQQKYCNFHKAQLINL